MLGSAVCLDPDFENGAWGQRFFECDHDHAIVDELTKDSSFGHNIDEKRQWLKRPKLTTKVREHMNEGGLIKTFNVYHNMLSNYTLLDLRDSQTDGALLDSPRYYLMCLGLLAIEHGWNLDKVFVAWLKANYASMYLNKERELQAKIILGEFRNGTPCKLGDVELNDMKMRVTMMSKADLRARGTVHPPGVNVLNTICIRSKARMLHDNRTVRLLGGTKDTAVDTIHFIQNKGTNNSPNILKSTISNTAESTGLMNEGAIPADTWREDLRKQNKLRLQGLYPMGSPLESGSRTTSLGSFHDKDAPVWTDGATEEDDHGVWACLKSYWHTMMYPMRLMVDNFGDNAYRLHGCFYLMLAFCLAVGFLLTSGFLLIWPAETGRVGWKEFLLDSSLLPMMVQFALYLFPPLFVRPLRS